jgi:REP element-mobilizing transposase RayT
MARGIERRKIFRDDKDRKSFLDRLAIILEETQTQCYAWSLIPNHFHLLLRTGPTPLSKVMRRLMTGYAVTFNKRHKRSGHLFQNRYKSVVCEEDPYLLELMRYIHMNPSRAGLVKDLKELDKYPWCGHSAILGKKKNPLIPPDKPEKNKKPSKQEKSLAEKTTEDVLLHFGDTKRVARRRYREFVKNCIEQGKRPELQGGGLVRSAGGHKSDLLGRKKEERETVIIRKKMVYPKRFTRDGYPLCLWGFPMKPRGIEYKQKRTKYACFKICKESGQPLLFQCDYLKEQYKYGYSCRTYFDDGYRKYGPAVPHSLIYKKLKPFRTGIERTFGLVKENRYRMEISNFYKGLDNVTIHAIEHDIVLTHDIIFDYIKSGKLSPVLNLNY